MQALFAKILTQNAENKPTTTEKVASGVAKTVVPSVGAASAVPIAMKLMTPAPSMFNNATANLAAQGVKFAPGIAEKATHALAENAIPQVVEAGENVIGG